MQRSGAATHRFYAAFYQWTVRSAVHTGRPAAARPCAGTGSTLGARRRQSTGYISHGAVEKSRTSSRTLQSHAKECVGSPELLRNEPIQSPTDRPSDSLEAWDHAVREKSEKSVTVEISVPRWITRDKDIANRAEVHEVKLSTLFRREDAEVDDLCSVLLAGDFSDVKAVWKHICTTGSPKTLDEPTAAKEPTNTSAEPIELYQPSTQKHQPGLIEKEFSLPEPFWKPIGKKGATEYFEKQHGVHVQLSEAGGGLLYMRLRGSERQVRDVDKFLQRVREWALEDKHEEMRRNANAKLHAEVVGYEDLRSEILEVWQSVTRRLLGSQIEEEFCLPELVWQEIAKGRGVENFKARFAIELLHLPVSADGEKRCVMLKGDFARLGRAKSWLEGFRARAPMLLEDGEYLRIYEAATGLRVSDVGGRRAAELEAKEMIDESETTPDRTDRFAIPDYMRQNHSTSVQDTVQQIQTSSGLARFDCPPLSDSSRYLRMTGTRKARDEAKRLLQQGIDEHNGRTGSSHASVEKLAFHKDDLPPPTHIAWIQLPEDMTPLHRHEKQVLKAKTDTQIPKGLEWTGGPVRVKGSEDGVRLAIASLREIIDRQRAGTGAPTEDLEVLRMGLIADLGENRPSGLSLGRVHHQEQRPARINESTAPNDRASNDHIKNTHCIIMSLPHGSVPHEDNERSRDQAIKKAVSHDKACYAKYHHNFSATLAVIKIFCTAAIVGKVIEEIQRLVDDFRKAEGLSAAKVAVFSKGLIGDMPDMKTVRQSFSAGTATTVGSPVSREQSQASDKKLDVSEAQSTGIEPTHFAWVKLRYTDRRPTSQQAVAHIKASFDIVVSRYRQINSTEGAISLKGSKEAVTLALEEIETVLAGERRRRRMPPPDMAEFEVLHKGMIDDMPDLEALCDIPANYRREHRSHFAWVKIPVDEGTHHSIDSVRHMIRQAQGCQVSRLRQTDPTAGTVRLNGSEAMIVSAIDSLQALVVDEGQKASGRPAAKIEILKMGLTEDMPAAKASMDLLYPETASTSITPGETTVAESTDHRSITQPTDGQKSGEQAKQVALSSLSGYSYRSPTLASRDAKKAEQQPAQQTNQQLGENMRSALRQITQPVALVTSFMRNRNEPDKMKLARGVTVSSFCTVTLQPVPVVSFNIRIPSRSWDAISESGHLRVHLLKATPEGAAAAHAFTLPYDLPHEPFERLSRLAAWTNMYSRTSNPARVPRIRWTKAVHADAVAKLLPEKCIQVGDHMIVVAEVIEVSLPEHFTTSDAGALAYGMKGYRQLGSEIKPLELKPPEQVAVEVKPTEPEMVADVEAASVGNETLSDPIGDTTSLFERFGAEPEVDEDVESTTPAVSSPNVARTDSPAEFVLSQSAIKALIERKVAEALKQQANNTIAAKASTVPENEHSPAEVTPPEETILPKNFEDLGPSSPILEEEALRQVLDESETEYSTKSLPSQTAAENPVLAEALNAVAGAYNDTPEPAATSDSKSTPETRTPAAAQPSDNVTHETNPGSVLGAAKRPWGVEGTNPPSIRKIQSWGTMPPTRHYSTSSTPPSTPHVSKKILKTTVADYLCAIPTHRKRYAALVETQRGAERIEAALQDRNQNADLSPEQLSSMQDEALTARRKVARELALRNVDDLAAMLDRGRVDMVRAQWLEAQLEAGQAVVLAEAKGLRRELEGGRLTVEGFEEAKGGLTADYDVIEGQLRRLRDFVDDDGVEGVDGEEDFEGRDGEQVAEGFEEPSLGGMVGEEPARETDGGQK